MSDTPLVFVVGLQKSGTTLLLKLLTSTSAFRNPVRFEGKELWGDDPPFTPVGYPAGHLYQQYGGDQGHELGVEDASDEIRNYLLTALKKGSRSDKSLVLKNPFNSGRLPWIRAMFPDAHIVAVVRRPLPNVFSLMKKHTPNPYLRQAAEEGWWGVKPAGWRDLVQDDKVLQCAWQWERINAKLWAERDLIDRFVAYHDFAADPTTVVGAIARATVGEAPAMDFPPLTVMDEEHLDGGRLESANRVYRRTKSLDVALAESGSDTLPPLTAEQQAAVTEICASTADALGLGLGLRAQNT